MATAWLFLSVLCLQIHVSVSGDETSVFVKEDESVQLNIQEDKGTQFTILTWTFNSSENIVTYINKYKDTEISDNYKNRVEFNIETFSLTLKNLQKTDSGLYTAKTTGDSDRDIAKYRISVLEPVEVPVIVLSDWSTTDVCNVTFSCKGHNLSLTSSCDSRSCSEEKVTSSGGSTLIVYVTGNSIICNYSNPVSWKMDTKDIQHACPYIEGTQPIDDTIYESVKDLSVRTEDPSTVYSTVGEFSQVPKETKETASKLETVYAFANYKCNDSSDKFANSEIVTPMTQS
ncbi:uncharacterized protein LOC115811333 [Chanos chanos]|uniref:Uncharacterized protein LOC115811333 n=1 Tax=Chanos chanos TaxID=29144 RepID=A0A6J2VDR0_CHACN|nr:uncharacterized protein LOC115811333 [Chanos chanos]